MQDTQRWGTGSSSPRKKPGTTPRLFSCPQQQATSPGQRPPPISTPPQLCSAERIAEPTNALLSRHTSCILRPAGGEDARHHLPRSPRCAQPGHPSAPETVPPPTTTPPHQAPARPHGRAQGPVWSPHPERVNPSPVKGESGAAGVIDSDRGCRSQRTKNGAESVPGCGAWDTSGGREQLCLRAPALGHLSLGHRMMH